MQNSAIKSNVFDKDAIVAPTYSQELKDVEKLTNELKRLLVSHEKTLNEQGIHHEVEILERWMESYRQGLAAAHKMSASGASLLSDLRDHLRLAIEERNRLEGEGGNSPTNEESDKLDELMKAAQRIESVLPSIEQVFHTVQPELEEV